MAHRSRFADERELADFVESTLGTSGPADAPRRIVAGFAGDEQAEYVLSWTEAVAKIRDADVTLVRAYGQLPTAVVAPDVVAAPILSPALMEQERQDAAFETEMARERLAQHGMQPKTRVAEGTAIDVIRREVGAAQADLVVLGGMKKGSIVRLLEPSVSTAITTMSHLPILLARGPFSAKHILIAVDATVESQAALRSGFALARAWDSQVTVAHVDPTDISWPLSQQPHRVRLGSGIETAYLVMGGVPFERIPEFAAEHDVDLVVTGGRSDRHFGPFYKPSMSRKISKRTNASVLIVKAKPVNRAGLYEKDD